MNLVIKGHPTRGKEVIQLLEMLGADRLGYKDTFVGFYYYIECDAIVSSDECPIDAIVFTLEEFEEKFPYKVGDKVIYERSFDSIIDTITSMEWENNEVLYITSEGYCVYKYQLEKLPPYKEETMEEPKELIIGFTKDDNGDWVLNTHKDYEIKEIEGKYKVIKKKPQYPKDYEECCDLLGISDNRGFGFINLSECENTLISHFIQLKRCRDAYYKIAGEQMGLGKPWEPNWNNSSTPREFIKINKGRLIHLSRVLVFPTAEMRDAFSENFKDLIEQCKELL